MSAILLNTALGIKEAAARLNTVEVAETFLFDTPEIC
jgi:hypothetical protein